MEFWGRYVVAIIISYLLGSLNFSIIISKALMGRDIREYGSGNAGSTNSYRMMGGTKTLLVMLGDILKGVVAVLISGAFCNDAQLGKIIGGAAVITGHIFPIYFGFKGGKGILTAAAVFGVFDYRILIVILSVFIVVMLVCRIVSLSSVCAATSLPIAIGAFYGFTSVYFFVGLILAAFVIFMHRSNISRLLRGEERRFSFKRKGEKQ